MKIDAKTSLYGVVGFPVGHSLGPVMHNAAFQACGLNAVYLAFQSEDAKGVPAGVKALGIRGMSVTIPHKSAIIPWLDRVDDLAKKIGAVNTLVNEEGRLVGYNTDALGALKAIEEKTSVSGKRCLILGAGGAARAIGFILKERGADLTIANRSPDRGGALADTLECPYLSLDRLDRGTFDLLIQTTPVGMSPGTECSPVPESLLKEGMTVMDVIYNPLETRLLSAARKRGCVTITGLGMFVRQGAEQFRLWTGMAPPTEVMSRAVMESLTKAA